MVFFTRLGFISQSIVFLLISALALMVAFGVNDDTEDMTGALKVLATVPFGEFLLWLIGIGLIAFILLMLLKSIKDTGRDGSDKKGYIKRIGFLGIACVYSLIAINAFRFATHSGELGTSSNETWSAILLNQPFGQWLVGIAGVIIMGAGIGQLTIGLGGGFMENFDLHKMNQREQKTARWVGAFGYSARSVVFMLIGYFVAMTAIQQDPNEAMGFDEALAIIQEQPYGSIWLSIVAFGLACYGIFAIVRSKYETVQPK